MRAAPPRPVPPFPTPPPSSAPLPPPPHPPPPPPRARARARLQQCASACVCTCFQPPCSVLPPVAHYSVSAPDKQARGKWDDFVVKNQSRLQVPPPPLLPSPRTPRMYAPVPNLAFSAEQISQSRTLCGHEHVAWPLDMTSCASLHHAPASRVDGDHAFRHGRAAVRRSWPAQHPVLFERTARLEKILDRMRAIVAPTSLPLAYHIQMLAPSHRAQVVLRSNYVSRALAAD